MTKKQILFLFWANVIGVVINWLFLFTEVASFINVFAAIVGVGGALSCNMLLKELENE